MQSMHRVIAAADMQCMSGYVEDCCQAAAAIDETVKKSISNMEKIAEDEAISNLLAAYRSNLSSLHTCAASGMLRASVLSGLDRYTGPGGIAYHRYYPTPSLWYSCPTRRSMWDSMESIWLACREDPACECRVMPLPYMSMIRPGRLEAVL